MLSHGDEMGRSQGGNNNPYCQDNATTWIDWTLLDQPDGAELHRFVARVLALRRRFECLRDLDWPGDDTVCGWTPSGEEVPAGNGVVQGLGHRLGLRWRRSEGDVLLLCHGATEAGLDWRLPEGRWRVWLDTAKALGDVEGGDDLGRTSGQISMEPFSLCLLESSQASGSKRRVLAAGFEVA